MGSTSLLKLKRLILGRRLASHEQAERKIGVIAGVPALGLDGLASSSYGPEAALSVLIPLGALGLHYIGPIILVILALLGILYVSYRQTIGAYPGGGGSYTVAKENLGATAGLFAAAALLIDYVLNVAVAVSAGVAALTSALPGLHAWTVPLCLSVLGLITLVNLRGTLESGWAFALPTYLFIASFVIVLGTGLARAIAAGGHPAPLVPPPALPPGIQTAGAWLVIRAFASGCTAMTGVEAVSNGVSAFKEPAVVHARRTLTAIVATLGLLLAGIAYLCRAYAIGAMDQHKPDYQSVLSQLVAAITGRGWFYYVAMGSLLSVLALSANTSFVDFPRLCRLIAADGYLPRAFAIVGRRLVFTVGILFLMVTAGLLLLVFRGITDRLIPLFAVGAFAAFTISQAGMVVHWLRERRRIGGRAAAHHARLAINAVGAAATGVALVVIIVAKFIEGAWITFLAVPVLVLLFRMVHRHYERVAKQVRVPAPLELDLPGPPIIVVPLAALDRAAEKSIDLAVRLSPDVRAVHLSALEGDDPGDDQLRQQWRNEVEAPASKMGVSVPHLDVVHTPYRKFVDPLMQFVEAVKADHPRRQVAILIAEVVKRRWWQFVLHNFRAERLRRAILKSGDRRTVLITVPWYLEE